MVVDHKRPLHMKSLTLLLRNMCFLHKEKFLPCDFLNFPCRPDKAKASAVAPETFLESEHGTFPHWSS